MRGASRILESDGNSPLGGVFPFLDQGNRETETELMPSSVDRLVAPTSCEGCGVCCGVVTLPPFRRHLDGTGEEAWDRLRWDRPELFQALLDTERRLRETGEPAYGTPCLWYDGQTRLCRHHEWRPRACRAFEIGGLDCRDARRRAGVDR